MLAYGKIDRYVEDRCKEGQTDRQKVETGKI
jgi:hypothetical protein